MSHRRPLAAFLLLGFRLWRELLLGESVKDSFYLVIIFGFIIIEGASYFVRRNLGRCFRLRNDLFPFSLSLAAALGIFKERQGEVLRPSASALVGM